MEPIYLVMLVEPDGSLTALVATSDEALAQQIASRMGDQGTVDAIPLLDSRGE